MSASPASLRPVIVALDVDTRAEALHWVDRLGGQADVFKVGLQLFCREGFAVVQDILHKGKRVFVDLKLHDIPNTVAGAVRRLAVPGVEFITLHASGGMEMVRAAAEAARKAREANPAVTTRLLAVTVLTSLDDADLRQIGVDHSAAGQVLNLTRLAREAGAGGVVASPQEARLIRREHADRLVIVTPGIRPSGTAAQDQKRVMTPGEAVREGSDFLVMGRSLLEASDPAAALEGVLKEIGNDKP